MTTRTDAIVVAEIDRESSFAGLAEIMRAMPGGAIVGAVGGCPVAAYLGRLQSRASRDTMRSALRRVVEIMVGADVGQGPEPESVAWGTLGPAEIAAIRAALAERYAPATANKTLAALRGVLEEAADMGLISDAAARRGRRKAKSVRGSRVRRRRYVTPAQMQAILEAAAARDDGGPIGVRDAAILALCYECGLRRAEVVALDVDGWNPGDGVLRVLGKGCKEREAFPAEGGARDALEAWLGVRGDRPGPMFHAIRKGGKMDPGARLAPPAVRVILQEAASRAGVPAFFPHELRGAAASYRLGAGVDISTIRRLMGHASVTTTQRYDYRDDAELRRAASIMRAPVPSSVRGRKQAS